MMEVSIYYKDGRRAYYSNVAQITNITGENLVLDRMYDGFPEIFEKALVHSKYAEDHT